MPVRARPAPHVALDSVCKQWLSASNKAPALPQFEGDDIVAYGDQSVLEYYGLSGVNKW